MTLCDDFDHQVPEAIAVGLRERGIVTLVDSDGDVEPLIPWLEEVGADEVCTEEAETAVGLATVLLREAIRESGRIGIAKMILRDAQHLHGERRKRHSRDLAQQRDAPTRGRRICRSSVSRISPKSGSRRSTEPRSTSSGSRRPPRRSR